ncbi:glycosyltransferase family 39 protein, partial [Candidatus Babeliales bacterium]|nr:glycosyltransferase family 39 protein [Candidatus Babeliales bacterium]
MKPVSVKQAKKKILFASLLFLFVFSSYALAFKGKWFSMDDLGVIINGLIKNWTDFARVFSEDIRNYASTYNYNFPKANLLSGLFRPMQNLFFSAIYHLFGANAYAFHLLHISFHALNTALFFLLCSYWIPLSISFLGSLLFAFYPQLGWMGWICTMQHTLTLFFLLLTILTYIPLLKRINKPLSHKPLFYLSGFCFLLSMLSRETTFPLAPWAFFGIYLFYTNKTESLLKKITFSLTKTWIFFAASTIYWGMRIYAFGFGSLTRTVRNIFIQLPFLAKLLPTPASLEQRTTSITSITKQISSQAVSTNVLEIISKKLSIFTSKFFIWTSLILNHASNSPLAKIIITLFVIFLLCFLFIAYRKQKKVLLFLGSAIPLFVWSCFMVYPAVRYMNTAYPLFIFIVILGISFFQKNKPSKTQKYFFLLPLFFFISLSLFNGFQSNIIREIHTPKSDYRKNRYFTFFKENKFEEKSDFIFISTLDESDLEQMLQVASENKHLKAAHIVISKLASKGHFECTGDYRLNNIKYEITPIPSGYR